MEYLVTEAHHRGHSLTETQSWLASVCLSDTVAVMVRSRVRHLAEGGPESAAGLLNVSQSDTVILIT